MTVARVAPIGARPMNERAGIRPRDALFAVLAVVVFALAAPEALAHAPDGSLAGGFAHGFAHPFGGLDHLLAFAALGLAAALAWPFARPLARAGAVGLGGFALVHGLAHGEASAAFALGLAAASGLLIGFGYAAAKVAEQAGEKRARAFARAASVALAALGFGLLVL